MKIVVIGGTGLIGDKLVNVLRQRGHEAVAASRTSGVNTVTGEGLAQVLVGARVVVDVSNSSSFDATEVLRFFEASGRNLLAAEATAGVQYHVALSIVGLERLPDNGYFRAKLAQEALIKAAKIPYSIVRSTQFFELLGPIAQVGTDGQVVRLSPALVQPIASDDVAIAMADVALAAPLNGTVEIAGPERVSLAALVQRYLTASGDSRRVTPDEHARYFGAELSEESLISNANPRLGVLSLEDWMAQPKAVKPVDKR